MPLSISETEREIQRLAVGEAVTDFPFDGGHQPADVFVDVFLADYQGIRIAIDGGSTVIDDASSVVLPQADTARQGERTVVVVAVGDRKSTRLNSSHRCISY